VIELRMKWYETVARYLLGAIYLFGAIDGALFLFWGVYIHGKPADSYVFLVTLEKTTYFWAFMKFIQLIGALSLLLNYKPVLGVALLTPISSVICLFYLFEFPSFLPFGFVIAITTAILCRAYSRSYIHLLDDYPSRREVGHTVHNT